MCWSCNPYCGGCKPPKEKPVKCAVCNGYSFPELTNCKKCGAVLPERTKRLPVMCLYIEKVCANPCNRHKKAPDDGQVKICVWHTPVENEPS